MRILLIALFVLCTLPARAADDPATIWALLKEGGRVALIRHAATTGGAGDPPGFRLEDCATQRNLTEQGRADAKALGARFRAHGIKVDKVLSSEWCRCRDTAALMDLGPSEIAPTFNNAFTLRDRVDQLTAGARAIVAAWKGPGTLVVHTHGANTRPLTGIDPGGGRHGGGHARCGERRRLPRGGPHSGGTVTGWSVVPRSRHRADAAGRRKPLAMHHSAPSSTARIAAASCCLRYGLPSSGTLASRSPRAPNERAPNSRM